MEKIDGYNHYELTEIMEPEFPGTRGQRMYSFGFCPSCRGVVMFWHKDRQGILPKNRFKIWRRVQWSCCHCESYGDITTCDSLVYKKEVN